MSPFDRTTQILHDSLRSTAGTEATYARGLITFLIDVIPCRTDMELVDAEYATTRASSDDFTINVFDLHAGGIAGDPAAGDRITIVDTVYELMDLPVDGCWRYADQTRSEYRVHTRKVE